MSAGISGCGFQTKDRTAKIAIGQPTAGPGTGNGVRKENTILRCRMFPIAAYGRCWQPTTMLEFEAARNLSVPDLLHLLKEKLSLEHAKLRKDPFPPAASTASLESEVSLLTTGVVTWDVV